MRFKRNLFFVFLFIQSMSAYSQVPGKSSKEPFIAVDKETYKAGDTLTMGVGSNTDGSFIYIYVPGNDLLGTKKKTYSSAGHGLHIIINHFSIVKNSGVTYGVFKYVPENNYDIGILNAIIDINMALESGELVSKSKNYSRK